MTWQVIRGALKSSAIDYDRNSPTYHLPISHLTPQTMQFINPKEGWLGLDEGRIARTTDGGLSWKIHQTGTTTSPIADLHFINSKEGWAIASSPLGGGLILHTTDGGDWWEILSRTNQPGIGVHFGDAKSGWIVMENGRSLITRDGGVTWKLRSSNLAGQIQKG